MSVSVGSTAPGSGVAPEGREIGEIGPTTAAGCGVGRGALGILSELGGGTNICGSSGESVGNWGPQGLV